MFYDSCLDEDIFVNEEGLSLAEFKSLMLEISNNKEEEVEKTGGS